MDDKINRQLTAPITEEDSSLSLADELVHYGFISKVRFSVPFCFIDVQLNANESVAIVLFS